jgi:hypothetical protein
LTNKKISVYLVQVVNKGVEILGRKVEKDSPYGFFLPLFTIKFSRKEGSK